jgi:hypothetical protein
MAQQGDLNWGSALAIVALVSIIAIVAYVFFAHGPREIVMGGRTPLLNSAISFYILNGDGSKGALAGSTTTDEDGIYVTAINASPNDFLLIEATNGSYAKDTANTRPLKPSQSLATAVSASNSSTWAAITPLTHMAAARARALAAGGTPLSTAVVSSNIGVARQYGLADIISNQPVPVDDEEWAARANIDERQYSLVIAGISEEAEDLNMDAVGFADALAKDASDGLLDGKENGEPITMESLSGGTMRLDANAGTEGVQDGIASAQVAPNLAPNQANAQVPLQPVQLGINGAGKFYITSTMLPAAIAQTQYNFQLTAQGGTTPYTCSLAGRNADNTVSALPNWLLLGNDCTLYGGVPLLAGGTTMSISQPFTIAMCDSANSCENLELRITTIGQKPEITTYIAKCFINEFCNQNIATAQGGITPYYFRSDYLRNGASPLGTIVDLNGNIRGTPTEMGTFDVGVCAIDSIGAYSCDTAEVRVISRNVTLYLTKTGTGTGKVYSNPFNDDNIFSYGVTLTLTATPNSDSEFTGWGGACSGTGTCRLLMDGDKEITAEFTQTEEEPTPNPNPPDTCGSGYHISNCGNGQTRCCRSGWECCNSGNCAPAVWCG